MSNLNTYKFTIKDLCDQKIHDLKYNNLFFLINKYKLKPYKIIIIAYTNDYGWCSSVFNVDAKAASNKYLYQQEYLIFLYFLKVSSNSKSITFIGHPKNKFLKINTIFILKQILNIYAYYLKY
ncbi:hypothetical protein C4S75_07560 [Apibacter sp. wkB309]|nr:hypothetical protein C4S75_07560 [Apibacter sp. wkB309]